MTSVSQWWAHLSWSDATLWVCALGFLVTMVIAVFAGDAEHDIRGSHEDQFANSSRRDYVSKRGIRG